MIARVGMLAIALVACAWFALGAHQVHELDAAANIVSRTHVSSSVARVATARLSSAATLNPDLEVDVLRGRLAMARGELPDARRIFDSVVEREPKDLEAWIWLARASAGSPATFRLAVTRIDRLLPPVPHRR
jgi:hypothetical protein